MLKDYFEVPNKPAIKSGKILSCDFTDHETFIPQPLDYSRGTLATYVDCNGLIKMSGVSDTDLITNGDFSSTSDWNIVNNTGTATEIINGYARIKTDGAYTQIEQTNVTTAGKTYKLQYTVLESDGGDLGLIVTGNSTVSIPNNVGTHIFYFVAHSTSFILKRRGGALDIKIDNVSVREVDVETPRIDYTTEIGKAKELQKPSLLLEPQSTNLFQYSESFSQGYWVKNNAVVQLSTITSPDGLQNSYKLISDAGTGGNRSLGRSFSGLSNFHTFSVLAKAGEYKYAILRTRNNPIVAVSFDLENGTFNINQSSAIYVADSAKIENYGNGWYRCSITLDPSQADTVGQLYPSVSVGITGNEINNFDGDGTSGIYVFGAQFEEENYSTSYIPTSGSTVTRNQDLANNAGQLGVFNSEEGVLYAEIAALADDSTFRSISINADSTRNDQIMIRYRTNSNIINFFIRDGGSVTFNNNVTVQDITEYHKVALKYKNGDIACWVDGERKIISTATGMPSGLSRLGFVLQDTGVDPFVGKVKEVKAFRRALTDAELTELTNNIV